MANQLGSTQLGDSSLGLSATRANVSLSSSSTSDSLFTFNTIGKALTFAPNSLGTLTPNSILGANTSLSASSTSSIRINKRVDLVLSSIAESSALFNNLKGSNLQFATTSKGTLILVPEFDELIGRSRADSDRTLIVRADANLN